MKTVMHTDIYLGSDLAGGRPEAWAPVPPPFFFVNAYTSCKFANHREMPETFCHFTTLFGTFISHSFKAARRAVICKQTQENSCRFSHGRFLATPVILGACAHAVIDLSQVSRHTPLNLHRALLRYDV